MAKLLDCRTPDIRSCNTFRDHQPHGWHHRLDNRTVACQRGNLVHLGVRSERNTPRNHRADDRQHLQQQSVNPGAIFRNTPTPTGVSCRYIYKETLRGFL